MGDPGRFPSAKAFRSFTGLTPKASETGETDRKGQPMSKAGSSLLRTTLVRAADTARKQDPQLAAVYHQQMTERGKDHLGALCVVAACLAERAWTVMRRGTPYIICDTNGHPVTPQQAKTIITERWTVRAEVRARRRSKKAGKAPQKVLEGQYARGSLPRGNTPPPCDRSVKQTKSGKVKAPLANRIGHAVALCLAATTRSAATVMARCNSSAPIRPCPGVSPATRPTPLGGVVVSRSLVSTHPVLTSDAMCSWSHPAMSARSLALPARPGCLSEPSSDRRKCRQLGVTFPRQSANGRETAMTSETTERPAATD
jgi:hypothetical protein